MPSGNLADENWGAVPMGNLIDAKSWEPSEEVFLV